MKQTISLYDFEKAFKDMDRDYFSKEGYEVLYEFLNEIDYNMELDVISLCCDFTEDSIENVLSDYDLDSIEQLRDNTIVLELESGDVIYHVY